MSRTPDLPQLPHAPGVYLMRDGAARILYIGKAVDLKKRVASYFKTGGAGADGKTAALVSAVRHVDYVPTASEREALILERRLINRFRPEFNVMWRDDKSYPFIALTTGEDFPRLFLTRTRKRDRTLYFGPYPSVSQVRGLLRWAWRKKLFRLRPCDLVIEEGQPLPYEKVRTCLYLHTGECTAPCLGRISRARYKRELVDPARRFFSGAHGAIVERWEREMGRLSRQTAYEAAAEIRDRIATVRHMREPVSVREMSGADLDLRIGQSRAVQELRRALDLPRPPHRIECFDISHIQGTEKVAAMVAFDHGRPEKKAYRTFIIRTVRGIDDFQAMAEVVGRRYRRLRREKKRLPNLVLIDGGKGQLSAALGAVRDLRLPGVSFAALAKEFEEVYLPGRKEPLVLPQDGAALLLLRRVRDEAHRFAVAFHRRRRAKRSLAS